jgi:trimethylamine corrinoid protein
MDVAMLEAYKTALYQTDREGVIAVLDRALADGMSAIAIVSRMIGPVLEQLADDVVADNAALSQHFVAARISEAAAEHVLSRDPREAPHAGTIVIGTSQGDFHGLGRKIIAGVLRSHMYTVIDLGLNVAPRRFVDTAVEHGAAIIGISSMMVHTAIGESGAIRVRQLLREQGREDRIKIIVGGAPYRYDPRLYERAQANAWAPDGTAAVATIATLMEAVQV